MRRTLLALLFLIPLRLSVQPDTSDTRLLHSPTVSRDHIAFVYADDLWICDPDGRNVVRRLTSDPGIEGNPAFSPDGPGTAGVLAGMEEMEPKARGMTELAGHGGQGLAQGSCQMSSEGLRC